MQESGPPRLSYDVLAAYGHWFQIFMRTTAFKSIYLQGVHIQDGIEPYWDPKRDRLVYDIDGWVVAVELPRGEDIYVVGMTGNLFLTVWREQVKSGGRVGMGGVLRFDSVGVKTPVKNGVQNRASLPTTPHSSLPVSNAVSTFHTRIVWLKQTKQTVWIYKVVAVWPRLLPRLQLLPRPRCWGKRWNHTSMKQIRMCQQKRRPDLCQRRLEETKQTNKQKLGQKADFHQRQTLGGKPRMGAGWRSGRHAAIASHN